MIVINHSPGKITISGHAYYARPGKDIVCAAVSVLTQVFIGSVEELTEDTLQVIEAAPNEVSFSDISAIKYGNLTEQSQLLLSSFLLGCEAIAASYPEHVKLTKH